MCSNNEIEKGIIASASYIVDKYDQPTMARNLLSAHGITAKKVKSIGSEYDKENLSRVLRKMKENE